MSCIYAFTCAGTLTCVIYYGGNFIANKSQAISVIPLPRAAMIQPLAVTSERDVTQVITCSAVYPADSAGMTVSWFVADKKPANKQPILQPVPGMYQRL